jgi:hypothetical protein
VICLCGFRKEITGAFYSSTDKTWNPSLFVVVPFA